MTRRTSRAAKQALGAALVAAGLYLAAFGNHWAPMVLGLLPATYAGGFLELLVPFLPMACIGSGAVLLAARRRP